MLTGASVALALLLGVLLVPGAQARAGYRIGFLGLSSTADYAANLAAFRQGLRDLGYEEGRNISIEFRWAENRYERLPRLAVELVRLQPDVLVTHAAVVIRAAQQATSTVPIVMGVSADPVRQGFVKSLARPGGNTTGVASQLIDLSAKRLELLRDTVPNVRKVAVLANMASAGTREVVKETEAAARRPHRGSGLAHRRSSQRAHRRVRGEEPSAVDRRRGPFRGRRRSPLVRRRLLGGLASCCSVRRRTRCATS